MFRRKRSGGLLPVYGFTIAGVVLILDQLSKYWITQILDLDAGGPGAQVKVLDPIFNLTMVWNRGVSFGLFTADSLWQRSVLIGFSLAVSAFLVVWMTKTTRALQALAFGLIIGGAVGNVIDRALYGAVVDFLDFSGLYFPYVFNIADAGICVGVALLFADLLFNSDDARR
ncbi:signal peptidase II [Woodsholea maritima]|uniref:signal peptidase II n=1 Tax=Woodsholea maritima TaxID=240237 RepID=UPI0003802B91|nr:signal peptidase II [Woodsholea maritima]